ncbi:MAG: hypothetical protein GY897_15855, partial [Alteromonas sp.]|nr:hypothetical protein [Alteromonas sp.]
MKIKHFLAKSAKSIFPAFCLIVSTYATASGPLPVNWITLPGTAKDIAVGASDSVWIIGTDDGGVGNYSIHKWTGSTWNRTNGGAVRIAVQRSGLPWVVQKSGAIHRANHPNGTRWTQMPGSATDISIGADGSMWIISSTLHISPTDYMVQKWKRNYTWIPMYNAAAVRIAVGPDGIPWVVISAGHVYRGNDANGSGWTLVSGAGTARDIGIGANGSVWIIGNTPLGAGYDVLNWNGTTWQAVDAGA